MSQTLNDHGAPDANDTPPPRQDPLAVFAKIFAIGQALAGKTTRTLAESGMAVRREPAKDWPTLRRWWAMDEPRLVLFTPVWLGIGIGLYFLLPGEPSLGLALWALGAVGVVSLWLRWRRVHPWLIRVALGLCLLIAGFTCASIRTHQVGAPVLMQELAFADITGRLVQLESRESGWRLTVEPTSIEGLQSNQLPARIRVTWRGQMSPILPGTVLSLRGSLSPPPSPVLPGGFDFGRYLYFQKIGGVGFLVRQPRAIETGQAGERQPLSAQIEILRMRFFRHIRAQAPGTGGDVIAAIVTGKREAIAADAQQALRDSGLAHLLAISGLHMGLATGLVFFGLRFGLACVPRLALRWPTKKIASVGALFSGLSYLVISGGAVSARRAFIMTFIIFLAVLLDRKALSLRNVMIAAMVILATTPEALLHPGFQMSFAAVTALVAVYEGYSAHRRQRDGTDRVQDKPAPHSATAAAAPKLPSDGKKSPLGRLWAYALGVGVTDTIAATATMPFALFHFQRTALYSLPANLVSMPIMGLWIMPAILIAIALMPLGLDGFFWRLAAQGIRIIIFVGQSVSHWPGAVSMIPAQPGWWLVATAIGGCVLLLLRAPWRFAGLMAIPIMAGLALVTRPPDIVIADDGLNSAVITGDPARTVAVFDRRRSRFAVSNWLEQVGLDPDRQQAVRMARLAACDNYGCVATVRTNLRLAVTRTPLSLADDCAQADLVVAHFPVNRRLRANCDARLIDRRDSWNAGAHAIWIGHDGDLDIRTTNRSRAGRPWGGVGAQNTDGSK
ncbi:MAG: ComEC/Rec2 family competence protein [Pseudomonadota bacterium]